MVEEIKDDIKIEEATEETKIEEETTEEKVAEEVEEEVKDDIKSKTEEMKEDIKTKTEEMKEDFKTKTEEMKDDIKSKTEEANARLEDQFEGSVNKSKEMAEKVGTNISKTVDNVIIGVKEIQKSWDEKVQEYRETSTVLIPIDLVNAKDYYYLQAALPGVSKKDIELEATENSITIKAVFQNIFKNIKSPEGLEPELVIKGLKNGNAKRTIPFANEIKTEEITAKFQDGALFLEIPKVETAKTKINID